TVRGRLRSQALGAEASPTRRKKRQEASHRGNRKKAGRVTASPLGEWRSVRAVAQQLSSRSYSSRIIKAKTEQNRSRKRKDKSQSRVPVTALIAWLRFDCSTPEP